VTFLFTDIEGSTRLWEENRAAMSEALSRHDEMLRGAIEAHDGVVFSTGGDGLAAAFQRAPDAVGAALDAQRRLQSETWDPPLSVRMAVHSGDVEERVGDYFGPPLNRCARLMASGHGGQVLCLGVAASLVADRLPEESALRDLGSHRLRDLSEPEQVFQLDHPALRDTFPPLRSLDSYRGNLPTQPTAFVGREAQVLEVAKAIEEARVVTLCGVGGVGKTRLAYQAGAHVLPRFPDGVWVVELASVGAADAVDETVASALGIQPAPGRTLAQSLHDHLGTKTILLVLDNCEHLLNPVAAFVDDAQRAAPGLTVLATSREGLGVAGERLMTVPSLEVPAPDMAVEDLVVTEAVRLFVGRAEETHATFTLSEGQATAVGELCRRLDGIPLAIELAAARVRVMTPKEILDHLDRRFKLLTAGRRTAATRHQTLQSTLDWSHDLLEEPERVVFRRLSVFAGDFDRSMVEVVVADDELDPFEVADALFKLVEKSLVMAQPGSELTRYRLLEQSVTMPGNGCPMPARPRNCRAATAGTSWRWPRSSDRNCVMPERWRPGPASSTSSTISGRRCAGPSTPVRALWHSEWWARCRTRDRSGRLSALFLSKWRSSRGRQTIPCGPWRSPVRPLPSKPRGTTNTRQP
jgi:predicted ATPase/class 3 adenylate cyclase